MLSRRTEDYLEAIFDIIEEKGYAKIKDISLTLNVKPSSVIEMVKKLDAKSLVVYKKYDGVLLTQRGEEIGRNIRGRHNAIRSFLEIIGVSDETADLDACIIEHELHQETIKQIKNLVNFVKSSPDYPDWFKRFEIFCNTGEHVCSEKKNKERIFGVI